MEEHTGGCHFPHEDSDTSKQEGVISGGKKNLVSLRSFSYLLHFRLIIKSWYNIEVIKMAGSTKKCPDCVLCMDIVYFDMLRFYQCWLCQKYYNIIDNKIVEVKPQEILDKHMELLRKQKEDKENEVVS